MDAKDILLEGLGRIPDEVREAVHGLTAEQLRWAPAKGANTIGWLVWHLTRVQDSHLAELTGEEQVYLTGDWGPRFGLESDAYDTGYGHSAGEVTRVEPRSAQVLIDYYRAVHEKTVAFVTGVREADLDRIVDERWDPPVTLGVRLVSVIDDDAQHAGQAAYLRGLLPGSH
jgi:uncharacterized damage-inducible protein DinB